MVLEVKFQWSWKKKEGRKEKKGEDEKGLEKRWCLPPGLLSLRLELVLAVRSGPSGLNSSTGFEFASICLSCALASHFFASGLGCPQGLSSLVD